MLERKAIYYGQVELIPGIVCDGYVLDDETAGLSERGTADLLGMDQKTLNAVRGNWPPKSLSSFVDKGLTVRGNFVEVTARNSPHCGREIVIYTAKTVESLIRAYALAFINDKLRKNQAHLGKRAVALLASFVQTAIDAAIKEACGFIPEIQKTMQKHYVDAVVLIQELGFTCSMPNHIATKKDIARFLKVPESTLNSFLRKHGDEIKPVRIDLTAIHSINAKAKRMNGYALDDVAKIAFGMDTPIGLELRKKLFGQIGLFATPRVKDETQWKQVLSEVFKGLGLHCNYPIDKYKVDFFVEKLMIVLECNGYCHRYYDLQEEAEREKMITQRYGLVRFHHKVSLETLFNGILQVKPGKIVRLYDLEHIGK